MRALRRLRLARPAEALVLARACLLAAVVCLALVVVPFSATAHTELTVTLAVIATGLWLGLRARAQSMTAALLHAVVVLATTLVSVSIALATTPSGTAVSAVAYVWIAVYSAVFHTRRALIAHMVLIGAGMAVGLWSAAAPSGLQTWGFLLVTFTGIALVLNGKVVQLRDGARLDALTGALSRGAFTDAARTAMARAARDGRPLTVALFDLDGFKRVNDDDGHAAGDAVLVALTQAWTEGLRQGDVLGRMGGDEFALLLPATDHHGAGIVVDRLHETATACAWSTGLATWVGPSEALDVWLQRADRQMYAAKRSTSGTRGVPTQREPGQRDPARRGDARR
ncbi:MAG: diguanylate cyclase [Actinotalea sp.]|nr:diguanylate cyclase [Actinotalea sp.]